ncbi:hypothetical protein Pan258_02590 [Symmachiella dynata]|nr:hypothetical protein Pan258_02590 [Symmachiella dynata]
MEVPTGQRWRWGRDVAIAPHLTDPRPATRPIHFKVTIGYLAGESSPTDLGEQKCDSPKGFCQAFQRLVIGGISGHAVFDHVQPCHFFVSVDTQHADGFQAEEQGQHR